MSKRLGLLIVMMLFVSLMTGCFGSDDSSTPTPVATSSIVITGTIPALSAPTANMPNFAPVAYGTNYEMLVVNGATMTEITGSAVVINGTNYTATVPAGAANVTALVVIRHKATGKIVYSVLVGNLPTAAQMSAATLTKVNISGANLTNETTALATIAKDKNIVAPTVPVTSQVTTTNATVKSNIENAVGAATVTAIKDATAAINAVLNNSSVSATVKNSILSTLATELKKVLEAFVTAVKDATAVVSQEIGTTTLTVGGTTISSTTTPAEVEQAVNHVTVVTVASINAVQDIVVGNGTAQTAIPFPTTVTVVMSDSTTATKNVVWSTTSTPAYNATTAGTYTFTGTVDGTTLTASVKVIVGGIQLRVSNPVFSPVGGVTYTSAQSVTISCATEGATIHYTVDGSEPTTSSPVYSAAINVAATTTIKALAVKDGMTSSEVITAVYTINIPVTLAISNGRAIKKADGTIAVTWNTNIAPTKGAKVSLINTAVPPSAGVVNYVNETSFDGTNHSVILPTTVVNVVTNYNRVTIAYILSEEDIVASNIDTFEDESLNPILSTVVAVNGKLTLTFTGVAVPTDVAVADFAVKNSINGSTYADVTPSAITRVSDTVVELAVASISATTVDQVVIYSASYKSGTVVMSGSFTVAGQTTTKVLTGIALAKDADTVEANVAYTLPAATASYDDNSTGVVTATWVEVLEGGTAEVTGTSVTKTTAGTYTFMASYTEGGVTKTANFSLVVTEAVPVKTLDSITVVATPAAPTCLVGGTTSVALVVTAHYLTGTATSEAVVTTYTTGDNWANGVFTAKTTVAGTENIVVTYVEGGVTKTANVAVTVSVEAPKPTTVTVTAIALKENASATAEVVVKDQFGATMTTGFTLTYASSNTSVFAVASTGVVTAAAYNSGTPTGTLTVTATPTTGTAVTGTATVTVSADTTVPTLDSVTVVDAKTIVLNFNKELKQNGAEDITNYSLYIASSGKLLPLAAAKTNTGAGAATDIGAYATLLADKKKVQVTITDATTTALAVPGMVLDGFAEGASYSIYIDQSAANKVGDLAATQNVVVTNSNKSFIGVSTPSAAGPALQTATFNTATKLLTLNYDKVATIVDMTKITLSDGSDSVTLTASETKTQDANVQVKITLANSTTTTKLATMTGTNWTVSLGAAAVKDASNNNSTAVTNKTLTTVVPPVLVATGTGYSEVTRELTVKFSKQVKVSTLTDLTQITITSTGVTSNTVVTNMSVKTGTASLTDTLVFTLTKAAADEILKNRANAATEGAYKVKFADNSIADNDGTNLNTGSGSEVNMTYTKDTTAPKLSTASFDSSTKKLTLTFDKQVAGAIAGASFILYYNNNGTMAVIKTDEDTSSLKNGNCDAALTLNTTEGARTTAEATINSTLAGYLDAVKDKSLYVKVLSGNGIKDLATNDLTVSTTESSTMAPLTYNDRAYPTVAVSAYMSGTQFKLTFSKAMNKTLVETATNYTIYQTTNSANTRTVTTAALDSTGKIATITVNTALTSGVNFTLILSDNIKDTLAIGFENEAARTKTLTLATTQPDVTSTTYVDGGDAGPSAGDTIKIKFDQPIMLASGQTLAQTDFVANGKFGASAPSFTVNGDELVITMNAAPTLDFTTGGNVGEAIIATGDGALSKIKNLGDDKVAKITTAANGKAAAPDVTAPVMNTAVLTDVNNNGVIDSGDKITVTFAGTLKRVATLTANEATAKHFTLTNGAGVDANVVAEFSGEAAPTGATNTAVLTLTANALKDNTAASILRIDSATPNVKIAMTNASAPTEITNIWGIKIAADKAVNVTVADTTQPTLTSIAYNSVDKAFIFTFNKPVAPQTSAKTADDITAELVTGKALNAASTGGTIAATDGDGALTRAVVSGTADYKTVVVRLVSTFNGIDALTTGFTAGTGDLFNAVIQDIGSLKPIRTAATYSTSPAYVYETTSRGSSAYNTDGTYTFATSGTAGGTVTYDSTSGSEKLVFYSFGTLNIAYTSADQKAFAATLIAGDKITVVDGAINAIELTASADRNVNFGALAYKVTVADVANTKTLTLTGSAIAATTVTKTTGSGKITLATAAPTGITVNGDAAIDINNLATTITDVATTKTLTLTSTGGTPALTVTATTGTGKIKMGTANVPVTVNGDAIVDANALASTVATVAAGKTLTLTNSGVAAAVVVTATNATGTVKLAGTAPTGITVNGSANINANALATTITDVANGATLTLSNTGTASALVITATTGTGNIKLAATAPSSVTANGSATLDINNLSNTIADITAGTLTLTNSGDGTAGDVTVTKAGAIAGTLATVAAAKTFKSITVSSGTTLTALTVGAGSTVTTLTATGVVTTLTVNGTITNDLAVNAAGTTVSLGAAGTLTSAKVVLGANAKTSVVTLGKDAALTVDASAVTTTTATDSIVKINAGVAITNSITVKYPTLVTASGALVGATDVPTVAGFPQAAMIQYKHISDDAGVGTTQFTVANAAKDVVYTKIANGKYVQVIRQ